MLRIYGEIDRFVMPLHEAGVIDHYLQHLRVTHGRRRKISHALGRSLRFQRTWSLSGRPSLLEGNPDASPALESRLAAVALLLDGGGGELLADTPLAGVREVAWLLSDHGAPGSVRNTLFVYPPGGRRPAAVLKLRAGPEGAADLEREWQALRWLQARLPDRVSRCIPHPLRLHRSGDLTILVESYLPGRSLYVQMSRSLWPQGRIRRYFRAAAAWLAGFHAATRSREGDGARSEASSPESGDGDGPPPGLPERLRGLLASGAIRPSACHGDYWLRNLLEMEEGGTGVADWEAFRERSLPDGDLFFFPLSYGLRFPWRKGGPLPAVAAFRRTFLECNAVSRRVRDYLALYCQAAGLPGAALEPLFHHYLARGPAAAIDPQSWQEMAGLASTAPWNVCRP